jgi:hypothetical protein
MFLLLFFMFLAGKSWISLVDTVDTDRAHGSSPNFNMEFEKNEIRKWFV